MLLTVQQVAFPCTVNNKPIFKSDIVIGNKFQTTCRNAVCTGLGEIRKRIDNIAGVVDGALVGETAP